MDHSFRNELKLILNDRKTLIFAPYFKKLFDLNISANKQKSKKLIKQNLIRNFVFYRKIDFYVSNFFYWLGYWQVEKFLKPRRKYEGFTVI